MKNKWHDIETPFQRWERGVPHRPESIELFEEIADIDLNICNDYLEWKSGGDGDNGEHLMYILDMILEKREKENQ